MASIPPVFISKATSALWGVGSFSPRFFIRFSRFVNPVATAFSAASCSLYESVVETTNPSRYSLDDPTAASRIGFIYSTKYGALSAFFLPPDS